MSKRSSNDDNCNELVSKMPKYCDSAADIAAESEPASRPNLIVHEDECVSDKKFIVLPTPTKSEHDNREYRVIKLENGLTALLISDMQDTGSEELQFEDDNSENFSEGKDDASKSSGSSDEEEDSKGSCHEAVSDGEESEGSCHEAVSDGEESEGSCHEALSDGEESKEGPMKQKEKLAAVGLCVGVGSYSDPSNIPGLAHFLEHMVFMGSEKYPTENSFDEFLKVRGGSNNATTDTHTTSFYFDCHERHLRTVLDRFAQFFISPLLRKNSMKREREAVHSEFKQAATNDSHRKEQLVCGLAKDGYPATKFTWGNMKTLKDDVGDDELYEALKAFHKRHYSSHRMTVAIQARLPMSILEDLVTKTFMNIPCNNLPPIDFSQYMDSFDNDKFHKLYRVLPVHCVYVVDLTWAFPSLLSKYRSKPNYYLSWVIGHEGKGSLLSLLRERLWALYIFCGNDRSDSSHNSMYSLFTISIVLTSLGYKNTEKVLDMTFGYINMLKRTGPSYSIYEELKAFEDIMFQFSEEVSAYEYVESLVEAMHYYPPQDYLTGNDLFFEYDHKAIEDCLSRMNPETVNVVIMAPDTAIVLDKEEPWFNTQYRCDDIPKEWIHNWRTQEPHESFHLPEPNKFVPTNFDRVKFVAPVPRVPVIIRRDECAEVWYRPDDKFIKPETYIYCSMTSPVVTESACNCVMLELFAAIFSRHIAEEIYAAEMMGMRTSFTAKARGIRIKIDGFSHKLHQILVELVAGNLASYENMLNESVCDTMLEELKKSYFNEFVNPPSICKDLRFSVLVCNHWTYLEKFSAATEVTFSKFKSFLSELLSSFYVQILVQGNYSEEEAYKISDVLISSLPPKTSSSSGVIRGLVRELAQGKFCCISPSFNDEGCNSVVTNYYQFGPIELKTSCILELIMMIMQEPLFNTLRTKKQLGYHVSCDYLDTYGIMGLSISVYFQSDKFSAENIDEEIELFMNNNFMEQLKNMKKNIFEKTRRATIIRKKFVDLQLKEEVERNWSEIMSGDLLFNRWRKEVECLQRIQLPDVIHWCEQFLTSEERKALSVRIIGQAGNKNMNRGTTDEEKKLYIESRAQAHKRQAEIICENISTYKKNLFVYPEAHLKL